MALLLAYDDPSRGLMYDDALLRYWVVCCIMMATTKARH